MSLEGQAVAVSGVPSELPDDLAVLDVRENDEWDAGHIPGAVHIPLMQLPQRLHELPAERRLLVVCRSGGRSAQATAFLAAHGYDAVNLAGGLVDWQAAGRALASGQGAPGSVL